jgi:glycosyltransferase involved in cell wall biosynthesis
VNSLARPKVSIIMSNMNKEKYIRDAIESILRQTYDKWELIIVDAASTDGSRPIIKEYASSDERIKSIFLDSHCGVAHARNIAISHSSGELIALLDSDDVYAHDKLERQLNKYMQCRRADTVIYSDWFSIRDSRVETASHVNRGYPTAEGMILDVLLASRSIVNSTLMFPKKNLSVVGSYNESLIIGEDMDLTFRLAHRFPFAFVNKPLYGYRIGIPSLSTSKYFKDPEINPRIRLMQKYIKLCRFRDKNLKIKAYIRMMSFIGTSRQWHNLIRCGITDPYGLIALFSIIKKRIWSQFTEV